MKLDKFCYFNPAEFICVLIDIDVIILSIIILLDRMYTFTNDNPL